MIAPACRTVGPVGLALSCCMIQLPLDAPGSAACDRSGLPLVAVCPAGHRRTVPFRRLRTGPGDETPLYSRSFSCKACGSPSVTLFALETFEELDDFRATLPRAIAPIVSLSSTRPDPDAEPL